MLVSGSSHLSAVDQWVVMMQVIISNQVLCQPGVSLKKKSVRMFHSSFDLSVLSTNI